MLSTKVVQPLCLAARPDDKAWRWHECFVHLHFEALKQLDTKEMAHGMPQMEHVEHLEAASLSSPGELPSQGEA